MSNHGTRRALGHRATIERLLWAAGLRTVPRGALAGWCGIRVVVGTGTRCRVAVEHPDEVTALWLVTQVVLALDAAGVAYERDDGSTRLRVFRPETSAER